MRLRDIMASPVVTVPPEMTASQAETEMRRHGVHHLVVTSGRDVLGVLSDRDLGDQRPEAEVGGLMSGDVVTASPHTTVRRAANLLRGRGIGSLPVVEGGRVVGIVTISDLLRLVGNGTERPAPKGNRPVLRGRRPRTPYPLLPGRQGLGYA